MKKTILLAALVAICLASCQKEDNIRPIYVDPNSNIVVPEGAIASLFSVDTLGHCVCISRGNLQWCPIGIHQVRGGVALGTWRFALHQYDIVGADNRYLSDSSYLWIDLFGWGTSGYGGKEPYLNVTDSRDYGIDAASSIAGTDYDWGLHNAISNGGDTVGLWRTLTDAEWRHLLMGRRNSRLNGVADPCYAEVRIDDIPGLLLFPDHFVWPATLGAKYPAHINTHPDATWQEVTQYTPGEFAHLEAAGCVFLPAAGYRTGTYVNHVALGGHYWSSTCYDSNNACHLTFYPQYSLFEIEPYSFRYYGISVRLVHDL